MAQITVEEFKNFFKYYKGEEQQIRGVEELYRTLDLASKESDADWIVAYRTKSKPPAGTPVGGIVSPLLMEQLTGYKASAFDQNFCDDCNRLFAVTGFDKHLSAMQMLMANMMHETANFVYMKEIASGEAYNNRADFRQWTYGWAEI